MSDEAADTNAENPAPADVLLADGSVAVIRSLRADDGTQLHELHQGVSEQTLRLRFFSVGRAGAQRYVDHVLHDQPLTLVLVKDGRVLAVATAEPIRPDSAEVSFLVEDGRHGLGIGSLLLEHLAAAARERGISSFVAEVLLDNRAMLNVFTDAGFTLTRKSIDGVVDVRLDTRLTDLGQTAADARERRSEARSLHPLLYPRSIVVAGVRGDGEGIGRAVLDNIRAGGYTGQLHVVHPRVPEIEGVHVVATFAEVPGPIDLAVIAVPAERVLAVVADAADADVPAAVVISSGFQELGNDGARLQRELARLARNRGIRVVGPNCLGLMSNHPEVSLNATFTECVPPGGGLAVATQSGGVGIVLADLARDLGVGIGSLISLGNKVDVSGNDLLAAWTDDPRVTGAAFYLESFGNAPKFARVARRFAERKPLMAVVGGRSAGGRRAGASHTAAAATPSVGIAALFAQAGVIGCDGAEDLAETALLLTREPLTQGPRLAVVSNAGGMGVLAADSAATCGLAVPELTSATRNEIARHVLGTTGTSNPIDAGAGVAPDELAAIVEAVLTSGEVDAVLVEVVQTSLSDPDPILKALAVVRERHAELPLVLVLQGTGRTLPGTYGLTTFRSSGSAVRALGRAAQYAAWLSERTRSLELEATSAAEIPTIEALVSRRTRAAGILAADAVQDGWVGVAASAPLLEAYGLQAAGGVARGAVAVAGLAESIGFPVVVKVADGEVVHRTERGLVRVGLNTADAVTKAVLSFESELGCTDVPVLVQPVVAGVELALGVVRDPSVGPLVMVGAGGINTDILQDRVYLLPPLQASDVRRSLRALRCWPLLEGFRGSPAADIDSLVELVLACGRLAEQVPLVAELDLNPVMVSASGSHLVDVKLRLAEDRSVAADQPRQLRRTT